jgi:abequosyltransferase
MLEASYTSGAITPLLAISIPTYNRAAFLPELLASIEREWDPRLEVVVSDNASTDGTAALLEEWRLRLPCLKIVHQSENIGPDRNFVAVVAESSAPFCWLIGSDDALAPGAVATMLRVLTDRSDIAGVTTNYVPRSYDLSATLRGAHDSDFTKTRILSGADDVFAKIGHHLGFLSSQVVRRSLWLDAASDLASHAFHNGYIHVYLIGRMLALQPDWLVLSDRLVWWRTGNDSFLTNGRLRRMRIDVEGYAAIGAALFNQGSATERQFRTHVAGFHILHALLAIRRSKEWNLVVRDEAHSLLKQHYRDLSIYHIRLVPLLYAPSLMFDSVKWLRQQVRRMLP